MAVYDLTMAPQDTDRMCSAQPGCMSGDALPCWEPYTDDTQVPPDVYYCAAHAWANGFCIGCGLFWSGVETFELSPTGLCENCQDEADRNDLEMFGEWDGYDFDPAEVP